MEAKGKSPSMQQMRKRSLAEPGEPHAKRRPSNSAAAAGNASVSVHPPVRVRQLNDGTASDGQAVGSTSATPAVLVHFCGHCQKRFRSPGKLAQHERVHAASGAAFYCSFCPKQFSCQSKVTRHERRHTGEKPYACSMCPRRFSIKCNVAPHERTHTGEKPYACSICPMRFCEKNKVAPHERTHTGEKPYGCFYCGKSFAESGTARRHERTQHRGTD